MTRPSESDRSSRGPDKKLFSIKNREGFTRRISTPPSRFDLTYRTTYPDDTAIWQQLPC